jgi:hypothetical protein
MTSSYISATISLGEAHRLFSGLLSVERAVFFIFRRLERIRIMENRMMFGRMDIGAASNWGESERAYREWIVNHTELRDPTSERRRWLVERDDHGEKLFAIDIWWPVLHSFEH